MSWLVISIMILGAEEQRDKRRRYQHIARTARARGDDWRDKVVSKLERHDGDLEKSAEELRMEKEALKKVLRRMNLTKYLDRSKNG